jgi:thiol-disulfide isomerase/thioredoxin
VTGLYVLLAALVAATAFGLVWRRRDGRIRLTDPTRPAGQAAGSPGPAAAGSPRPAAGPAPGAVPADAPAGTGPGDSRDRVDPALLAALGVTPAPGVTLLQFSSAFCAPCRTTRVLLADVAGSVEGVRHVEVDAESHLDAVRALDILRTPTTLVLDGEGRIRGRASGAPRRDEVLAVVRPLAGNAVPRPGTDPGPAGRV